MDNEGRINVLEGQIVEINKNLMISFDRHAELSLEVTALKTRIDTTVSILKWFVSPVILLNLLLSVLRGSGVIN